MLDLIASFISSGLGVNLLYTMIGIPAVVALLVLIIPKNGRVIRDFLFMLVLVVNGALALGLLRLDDMKLYLPWAGGEVGINFALRVYNFSQQIVVIAAFVAPVGRSLCIILSAKENVCYTIFVLLFNHAGFGKWSFIGKQSGRHAVFLGSAFGGPFRNVNSGK